MPQSQLNNKKTKRTTKTIEEPPKKINKVGVDIPFPLPQDYEIISQKKMYSSCNMLKLSTDEMGEMLNYLSGKDIIGLAFTCKVYFNFVMKWARMKYPLAIGQNGEDRNKILIDPKVWSLIRALECHDCLVIGEENYKAVLHAFEEIAQRYGGNLHLISPLFKFCSSEFLFWGTMITDIFIPNSATGISLPYIKIEKDKYEDGYNTNVNVESRLILEKTIHSLPVTFKIKKLWFDECDDIPQFRLFEFLSNCLSLEELLLDIDDSDDDYDSQNQILECPMLNSLKYLEIISRYNVLRNHQFVVDILKLAPNLEAFYCHFHVYHYCNSCCGQDFLKYLTKMCPNLLVVNLCCIESERSLEISDQALYEFLKSQPKLAKITIDSSEISGEIFSKIGEFSQLEYIAIYRRNVRLQKIDDDDDEGSPIVAQCINISFGGGILLNLTKVLIGDGFKFSEEEKQAVLESLYKIAPNIDKSVNIFIDEGVVDDDNVTK